MVTLSAGGFALNTAEIGLALANTRDGMTGEGAAIAAVASLVAIQAEPSFDAHRTTQRSLETGAAWTLPCCVR